MAAPRSFLNPDLQTARDQHPGYQDNILFIQNIASASELKGSEASRSSGASSFRASITRSIVPARLKNLRKPVGSDWWQVCQGSIHLSHGKKNQKHQNIPCKQTGPASSSGLGEFSAFFRWRQMEHQHLLTAFGNVLVSVSMNFFLYTWTLCICHMGTQIDRFLLKNNQAKAEEEVPQPRQCQEN